MLVRAEQLEKVESPILVTLFGIVILVRAEQLEKVPSSMLVIVSGIVILVSL